MKPACILFGLGVLLLAGQVLAQPAIISVDPLIDLKNPMGLTREKVDAFYSAQPYSRNNNWREAESAKDGERVSLGGRQGSLELVAANGRLKIDYLSMRFDKGPLAAICVVPRLLGGNGSDYLVQELSQWMGGAAPVFLTETQEAPPAYQRTGRPPTLVTFERHLWKRPGYQLVLARDVYSNPSGRWMWAIFIWPEGKEVIPPSKTPAAADAPPEIAEEVTQPRPSVELKADLDPLLDFNTIWQTTADQFEKRYIARIPEEQQKQPPQFEWLTTAKDRARFSRQMFVDAPTTLTLFSGTVKVEEAVVEFVKGKAGRATISIYNRGDAGQMGSPEFQALFKKVGQSLGGALKVTPRRQMSAGTGAVKNVIWMWTSPLGVALLEHNDFESLGGAGKPEYLRLKVAAPDQADWTMGRMSLGVQRMALQKNVNRDAASGDTFISGVPMVDQGAKGYCVAASCQRLLEYMRIPCDQHEMAQLLSVDVERGANAFDMQKSLAKVDQKFGVAFKPLVNPEQYYSGAGKRRVSLKEFTSIIKEHADKGVPLLWALGLGQFPEDPPLPNGGQVSGGHMRMIIGYNSARNLVIFTDSWGAGHEKKRMKAADAYEATLGLYSMSPRGL